MDQAIIGLAGIVVGALLGGSGKYFTQRRDAWLRARASGLILLAEVRSVGDALKRAAGADDAAEPPAARGAGVATTSVSVAGWQVHGEILAAFRRGHYPSGLSASQWSKLARRVAHLAKLDETHDEERDKKWRGRVEEALKEADGLLVVFEQDPPVFWYVVRSSVSGRHRAPRIPPRGAIATASALALCVVLVGVLGLGHADDERAWVPAALYAGLALAAISGSLAVVASVLRRVELRAQQPPAGGSRADPEHGDPA